MSKATIDRLRWLQGKPSVRIVPSSLKLAELWINLTWTGNDASLIEPNYTTKPVA